MRKDWKEVWEQAKGLTWRGAKWPRPREEPVQRPQGRTRLAGAGSSQQARVAGEEPGQGAAEGAVRGKGGPGPGGLTLRAMGGTEDSE